MSEFEKKVGIYLPKEAIIYCRDLWKNHPFTLKISKPRTTKLGDYKFIPDKGLHKISVNNNLNPYSFLITYLHEVAHLITFERHGRKVLPHGTEWKNNFKFLCLPVLNDKTFPEDVLKALVSYLKNPKASSCNDHKLTAILSRYDATPQVLLADISNGSTFQLGGRLFKKEQLRRTRYVCKEIKSGRRYLISKSAGVIV